MYRFNKYKQAMDSGKLYKANDELLMLDQINLMKKVEQYNKIKPGLFGYLKRNKLLKKMFNEIGENCYIEAPFHSSWGGKNVHFGKNVYANFNLTLIDDTDIYVGDYTMIGPNVTLCTATHPLSSSLRKEGYQYNKSLRIGNNCWLGANVIVLPGVTIGNNVVIGAGSVVTKDIEDNSLAYGNPCRVIRKITEEDEKIFDKDRLIEENIFKL